MEGLLSTGPTLSSFLRYLRKFYNNDKSRFFLITWPQESFILAVFKLKRNELCQEVGSNIGFVKNLRVPVLVYFSPNIIEQCGGIYLANYRSFL